MCSLSLKSAHARSSSFNAGGARTHVGADITNELKTIYDMFLIDNSFQRKTDIQRQKIHVTIRLGTV